MSTLNDLLRQVEKTDKQLAADLKREVRALESRRAFGLNFERHTPESVELPDRPVRKGDKVRLLPERGAKPNSVDEGLWWVKAIRREENGRIAELVRFAQNGESNEPESAERAADDLVVIAEFRDPIYPGLVSTGKVERGGDKPYHAVLNAENYHALQALLYTHEGKVDAIYIDPPYNTGAKDWKYNNDYVDSEDVYRHSKWLAMMERRLKLAKRLLNPENSVLIVTIDEKEVHRLGLLLNQCFPESKAQLVSIVINPVGQERQNELARVEEYALFVFIGAAKPTPVLDDGLNEPKAKQNTARSKKVRWEWLLRGGADATRRKNPDLFFPILIDPARKLIVKVGDPLPLEQSRESYEYPDDLEVCWPIRKNGTEGRWRCSPSYLRSLLKLGYAKLGEFDNNREQWAILYLGKAQIRRVESGEISVLGKARDNSVVLGPAPIKTTRVSPKTVWNRLSHRAGEYGTALNSLLLPGRTFPYPKSLYSVEDALRISLPGSERAIVLDFFSGSGTTAHAVMRLNKQDDGRRQCISVTNNEVSADEQKKLRAQGLRPGDPDWEKWGICDYITKPRIKAAITGRTPEGEPIKGDYKFTDEFPMSDGFEENVEFFTLTYESPRRVAHRKSFGAIAPLLWLKAGSFGERIEKASDDFAVAEAYGVLFDLDFSAEFIAALAEQPTAHMAFVVTDEDRAFQAVCAELPEDIESVRLYSSYLTSFTINTGKE